MSDELAPESAPKLPPPRGGRAGGPLAWFARNSVAANVIMLLLLVGGYCTSRGVKREVFPEVTLDLVIVNVPYPGASPEEVEQGVTLAVEEAVRTVDGVKRVTSTSMESFGVVTIELMLGTDGDQALADVKSAVDRITSLPETAERPIIFRPANRFQVISLMLSGDQPDDVLRRYAEEIREELLSQPGITTVELEGVRPREISVEISQDALRRYGLTLEQVAGLLRASSIELPAGAVRAPGGDVLVRTAARKTTGREFEDIVVLSRPDGTNVRLGDIADVVDGFSEEQEVRLSYDGKPAIQINVFRVADQTPNGIAETVKRYAEEKAPTLPPGLDLDHWFDASELYTQRVDLLMRNAVMGLVLVMLILGLFLEVKLAFWVTLGIPISFLGAMLFVPQYDVSINMISLFAFILVLGMVVDDAIVVGEVVYAKRQEGYGLVDAAIAGVKEVAVPVTFAIVTTIVFYFPLLVVPGVSGKFFMQIPVVVIAVLLVSLFEALFILPAHLAHSGPARFGPLAAIHRVQQRFSRGIERLIERLYVPSLRWAVSRRYLTFATGLAILLATCGLPAGGHIQRTFMPKIESDVVTLSIEMPYGTAIERTREVEARAVKAAQEIVAANGGERIKRGLYSLTGKAFLGGGPGGMSQTSGGHLTQAAVWLVPIDQREISAAEFANQWRAKLADIPGIRRMQLTFDTGGDSGAAIALDLSHPDTATLERAATELADKLAEYAGVFDVDAGFSPGKPQLDLTLKPEARALGLTETDLARQIRASFFGAEASRFQRGRDEVRVYVRLPRDERVSEYNLEQLVIRTPAGGEIPLAQAAWIERGRSYTEIRRTNGKRTVTVSADVDEATGNANEVFASLMKDAVPALMAEYPGLTWAVSGQQEAQAESLDSLLRNGGLALLVMLGLLMIVFKSYVQPIIIATAIPFGVVGAIIGHLIFGFDLSLMSIMGIVALAGVAVNDSLVFVDAINERRRDGMPALAATILAGHQRFRPIILTSLTTFGGLMPMVLETSLQARFLIPMAVSLACGVLFCTVTTLYTVPAIYMIIEDARRGVRWVLGKPPDDGVAT